MGYIRRWDAHQIALDLKKCSSEMNYKGNDGFLQWGCKKDLLEIKYLVEELLANAPTFGTAEDEFIDTLEQQKIYNILKHEEKN